MGEDIVDDGGGCLDFGLLSNELMYRCNNNILSDMKGLKVSLII